MQPKRAACVVLQVQRYWEIYTKKVDHLVQEALRSNIKNSMKKLSKAINGDNKTTPNPLFQVLVVLREPSPNVTPKVPPTRSCDSDLMTNSVGTRVCVCPLAGGLLAAPPEAGSNGGHSASAHRLHLRVQTSAGDSDGPTDRREPHPRQHR